ncbi:NmrA/HSCARG family protein [Amycolatopsis roodepoortensis]|uniref:NmrA/HSCARG family protein n=1 Tax=Amycolatopsis roodepoortensis TaxID=700274 RepID=UPI00214B68C6|nr:NmrA/HSCARG family protein [Amycolatopsis roodepoortensis]UUV30011.1 NmrA/HSCARG family protein [Amycolatopsis roodepoortensis]
MSNGKIVLVTGATGHQGGATARHLLGQGWQVHAFVRDPAKPAARRLRDQGAVLVPGNLEDADSLRTAMRGVYGVFSVQALAYEPNTLAAEVRQGKTVADMAKETGVKHLVYSSVGGAERETGIDHFESKAEVERHIEKLGLPATILRPVFFMDNLLHYADADGERVLRLPVLPDRPMQMIASDDIGRIAAHAFAHPNDYLGERLEIAGDELSFEQVAGIYQRITGIRTRLDPQPIEERMFEWFADSGYQANLADLRTRFPELIRFETFLSGSLADRRLPNRDRVGDN